MSGGSLSVDVVIPSSGRGSLGDLLGALATPARGPGRPVERVIVVDDRPRGRRPLAEVAGAAAWEALGVEVVRGPALGPAAARNAGWRAASADWVTFLDDDVVPGPGWGARLAEDLGSVGAGVAGVQGRIRVPLPADRRPTDWERNVAGLETARWATADMTYRRAALAEVGGFDERFGRAYREDADLALRMLDFGWKLERGQREVRHPVRPAGAWVSVRLQAGNADDVLMGGLHGPGWRARAGAPAGRLRRHLAMTAAAACGAGAVLAGRHGWALMAGATWSIGFAELAWSRIVPGPRTPREVARMLVTSAVLPLAATWHLARGRARRRRLLGDAERAPLLRSEDALALAPPPASDWKAVPPGAVLLDRDGTLIVDVPYNGDPDRVTPVPGARAALDRLRAAGLPLGVVSNQSGVARGLLGQEDVARVNRRVEELLGPLGPWAVCPHGPHEGCDCRKPQPGLVLEAAERLGVAPDRCAVIGDIGADVEAARAAGARGVLVPNARTRPEEIAAAGEVATDLQEAVGLLIGEAP